MIRRNTKDVTFGVAVTAASLPADSAAGKLAAKKYDSRAETPPPHQPSNVQKN